MMSRKIGFLLAFLLIVALTVIGWSMVQLKRIDTKIEEEDGSTQVLVKSFSECIKAGYPVTESYPRQCGSGDGQVFVEETGNARELANEIVIVKPKPNDIISSPLKIQGGAKGGWYFEGSFPIKLIDETGNVVAQGTAKALGEWTTEAFVSFEATLEFESRSGSTGQLIFERDNPSGLPENAKQLTIPVEF